MSELARVNGSLELSPDTIRKYICKEATEQEIMFFLTLCKEQNLNPFLNEAYLIKYGTYPASQVVGKEVFFKRADRQEDYEGLEAGLIVERSGEVSYTKGAFSLSSDKILGGWAEVYRSAKKPFRIEVSFDEYAGKKSDGELNKQWKSKPATMIRKVACVQALREAYPETFQGMYDESELNAIQRDNAIVTDFSINEVDPVDMPAPPKPINESESPKKSNDGKISANQAKRFYAIAKSQPHKKTDDEINNYLMNLYGTTKTGDMSWRLYNDACSWAENALPEDSFIDPNEIPFGDPSNEIPFGDPVYDSIV